MKPKQYRVWAAGEMHYPSIITFDASGASFAPESGGGGSFRVPFTDVMEGTGIKDRNGANVYEDDILQWATEDGDVLTLGPVKWREEVSIWASDIGIGLTCIEPEDLWVEGIPYVVVGNTRQHPHLLERP